MPKWLKSEAGRPLWAFPLAVILGVAIMAAAFAQTYRSGGPQGFKFGGGYGDGDGGTTIEANGDVDTDGTVTAAAFVGDGSGLTGVSGAGDVTGPGSSTDNALARFDSTTGKVIQNSTATLSDAGTLTATAFVGDGSGLTGVSGAGDVTGPGSSTDNALPRFDSTTGKVLQGSGVVVDDSNNVSGIGTISLSGTVDGRDVATDGTKLDGIETAATADQSDSEIETAYNNQVAAASQAEMEAGTETAIRRMSPLRVAQAIAALASGTGDALTSNGLDQFASTTSAELAGVLSDETGSAGGFVRANGPTLVAPVLGTPASGTLTNATGLPLSGLVNQSQQTMLGRPYGAGTGPVIAMTVLQVQEWLHTPYGLTSTSNSVAWNSDLASTFTHTLTENTTIAATSGTPFDGQRIIFIITQHASSAKTLAWNAEFVAGETYSDTIPTMTTTLSGVCSYGFIYFAGSLNKWVLHAYSEY